MPIPNPTGGAGPLQAVFDKLRALFKDDAKLQAWLGGQTDVVPPAIDFAARIALGGDNPTALRGLRGLLNATGQAFPTPEQRIADRQAAAVAAQRGGASGSGAAAAQAAAAQIPGARPDIGGLTEASFPGEPGRVATTPAAGPTIGNSTPTVTPTPNPLGTPLGGGGGGTGNSTVGTILAKSPDDLESAVLRAMNMNPERLGDFGRIIQQAISPLVQASAQFLPYAAGTGSGGNLDPTTVQQWAQNFGKSFTTPGVDAYAGIRDWIGKV